MSKTNLSSLPQTFAGAADDQAPALELTTGLAIATMQRAEITNGKVHWVEYEVPVRVMAVAERYAMVRRKGCSPFALEAKRVRNASSPNMKISGRAENGDTTQ